MDGTVRAADGRRMYTAEFKREQVQRILKGEISLSELSRELGISRALLSRWKQLSERGGTTAVGANEDVVPASELRAAFARIRELERALGKKAMEVDILQAAREEVKKKPRWYGASTR